MFGIFGALDKVLGVSAGSSLNTGELQRLEQEVEKAVSMGRKETGWLPGSLQSEALVEHWRGEHPELFFLQELRTVKENSGRWKLQFRYGFTGNQLAQARTQLQIAVQSAVSEIQDSMPSSEYEGLLRIYEYLQDHVEYDMAAVKSFIGKGQGIAHSAYGSLVLGKAVCDGISLGFLMIARALGYECKLVTGKGNGGAHAWNMVKISGQWYHMDCTWDISMYNSTGVYSYHNLLLSDTLVGIDHQWNKKQFPSSTTEGKSHHHRVGSYINSVEDLRVFLQEGLGRKRKKFSFRLAPAVKIPGEPIDFCMACLREKQFRGSGQLFKSESANCFFLKLQ